MDNKIENKTINEELQTVLYLVKCALWDDVPSDEICNSIMPGKEAPEASESRIRGNSGIKVDDGSASSKVTNHCDYLAINRLAMRLKVEPYVKYALKLGDGLGAPRDWYEKQLSALRSSAVGRIGAAAEIERFQEMLRGMGIETAILKGQAVATAYRHPELRQSAGVDVYVSADQEGKVYDWAKEQGYPYERRIAGTRHGIIHHPILGLIELHGAFLRDDEALLESMKDEDAVLQTPKEPFTQVDFCGHKLTTIGMTDHMIFILSHMMFHYLHGEAQLRMILDVNMFFAAYQDRMNLEQLKEAFEKLRYSRVFAAILMIGNKYLGFTHDTGWMVVKSENAAEGMNPVKSTVTVEDADMFLLDVCCNQMEKDATWMLYDVYSMRTAPKGFRKYLFKLKIVATNIPVAIGYRRKLSAGQMMNRAKSHLRNLFIHAPKDTDAYEKAQQRLDVMEKMGMID